MVGRRRGSKLDKSLEEHPNINNGTSLTELTIVISDIESNENLSKEVITLDSDENENIDKQSTRPRRSVEKQNYNQVKLARKAFNQNKNNVSVKSKDLSLNGVIKRKPSTTTKLTKSLKKIVKQKIKKDVIPSIPNDVDDFDNLMHKISPFKTSPSRSSKMLNDPSSKRRSDKILDTNNKSNITELIDEENFNKISYRAFRYPWEWEALPNISSNIKLGVQQSNYHQSQILGFRTLPDGTSETLMWMNPSKF